MKWETQPIKLSRYLLPIALFTAIVCHAQSHRFLPILSNYSASEYKAGLQNWACDQGANGEIYIGNNLGLLCFDGARWELHAMPNRLHVRSILVNNDRIYVGSYNEFGYFKKDEFGKLTYHSLQEELGNTQMRDDDIWNIVEKDDTIYFQSFSSWFTYHADKVTAHYNENVHPLYFHKAHNEIYIQAVNGNFYSLRNNTAHFLFSRKEVGDDNIVAIVERGDNSMLLCTEWNGIFSYDGKRIRPWGTNIDKKLRTIQLNRATITKKDSTLILGSIRDGIYALDKNGKLKWSYSMNQKLYNNSVLRLFCDAEDNIWAALDNGVSLIHTESDLAKLEPHAKDLSFGMVYGVEIIQENIYIATNNGAYIYDKTTGEIAAVANTEGQNWHISQFDSHVLVGNNTGTKKIVDKTAYSIPNNSGSSTCIRKCRINDQEILLESSYSNLRVYKLEQKRWVLTNIIDNFSAPIRQLEIDHSGTIWAAHMNRGLYRLTLSNDLKRVASQVHYPTINGNASGGTIYVTKIRGRIILSDNSGLYTYDDLSQVIVPFTQLNEQLQNGIISATTIDDNTFWIANKEGYTLIKYENDRYHLLQTIRATYLGAECNETNNNVFVKEGDTYFCLNNAIARYRGSYSKQKESPQRELIITSVISTSQTEEQALPLLTSNTNRAKSVGYIAFSLSYPNYSSDHISYSYKLEGGGYSIKSKTDNHTVSFSNLAYGDYTFECVALNDKMEELSATTYFFTVKRPFYLSLFALAVYLSSMITIAYLWAKWKANKATKAKQKEYEAEKIKHDLQLLEQDKVIAEQQKQLLSTELSLKSKENASLALNLFARDKAIESFRELIIEHRRNNSISPKEAALLLSKFNQKFSTTEFLDVYQKNFDLIHAHFFRNLRVSYPSLTSIDLKFCALLRLNLSTKDISQITNLTIRGVEAARYRIRKKLDLPEGINLTDFLIDFKGNQP